jgi:hypothetical protein
VSQAELAMQSMANIRDMIGIDLDDPIGLSDDDFDDDYDDGGDPNDPDYMSPSASSDYSDDENEPSVADSDDVGADTSSLEPEGLSEDVSSDASNGTPDDESESVQEAPVASGDVSDEGHAPEVGKLSESDRVTFGIRTWSDAFTRLSDDALANEEASAEDKRGTHVNRAARDKTRRGGRASTKKGPVQIRGVQRSLFDLVSAEFPSLTNSKALEAFIAKATGRFDLVEDDEVRMEAMRASNVDGTISGLCNEMRAVRRSLRALRLETSTSALASIMNGVDAPDDELSEALFLRIKELRAVSAAYDAAMSSSGGRIPKGYE